MAFIIFETFSHVFSFCIFPFLISLFKQVVNLGLIDSEEGYTQMRNRRVVNVSELYVSKF